MAKSAAALAEQKLLRTGKLCERRRCSILRPKTRCGRYPHVRYRYSSLPATPPDGYLYLPTGYGYFSGRATLPMTITKKFFSPHDATMAAAAHHSCGVSVNVVVPLWCPKSCTSFLASGGGALDLGITAAVTTACRKAFLPVQFVSLLMGESSLKLEVDVVKKLWLLLQNEAVR